MFSFTLYSGLSARSRPWRSASQHTGPGDGVVPGQLGQIVPDAVFIQEVLGLEPPGDTSSRSRKVTPGVDHRLPLHHVLVIVQGDVDVGEHLQVRQPADGGAGFLPGQGG